MQWMSDAESALSIVALLAGGGLAAWRWWVNRLFVVRLVDAKDKWFDPAIALYERVFPDWERDESEELGRWLEEARRQQARADRPYEYLLAAIHRKRIVGFFYGTYYRSASLLFVSYLIIPRRLSTPVRDRVAKRLFKRLKTELTRDANRFEAIVAEVELPEVPDARERRHRRSRIKTLMALAERSDIDLRILDTYYVQPNLDLRDRSKREDPMLMLYGSTQTVPSSLPKARVAELIAFVYDELYGDCFLDDPEQDVIWRKYLLDLQTRVLAMLPEQVPCRSRYRDVSVAQADQLRLH